MSTTLNNQLTQSKMNSESIATYISNLEKDNAALRYRVKHLEGICQSLALYIETRAGAGWDDFEVSDDESVASDYT